MPRRVFLPPNCVTHRNKFLGGRGVGVYLSPVGGNVSDIVFRKHRPYPASMRGTALCRPMIFSGAYSPAADEILHEATVATAKLANGETDGEIELVLPAGYNVEGATFWVQVRTHEAGLENTSLFRPRQIIVSATGTIDLRILGRAALLRVVKLDGGGARIEFEYIPSLSGSPPESFVLRDTAVSDPLADQIVAYVANQRDFTASVSLTAGESYTFALFGVVASTATLLIPEIVVVSDAEGPAELAVSYAEET